MYDYKPKNISVPIGIKINLDMCSKLEGDFYGISNVPYVIIFNNVMYIIVFSKFNISQVVGVLIIFVSNPSREH